MPKIEHLREFLILSEQLNYSKAAEKAFITQPVLSRHIELLEKELGIRLLERSTHYVKLTPAGELAVKAFRDICSKYQSFEHDIEVQKIGVNGVIRISSPYYWTEDYLEPLVIRFKHNYPNCSIKLQSCQPYEGLSNLLNNRSDLALLPVLENSNNGFSSICIIHEPLCVVCASDHAFAEAETIDYIITRDKENGFKNSPVKLLSPEEFLSLQK